MCWLKKIIKTAVLAVALLCGHTHAMWYEGPCTSTEVQAARVKHAPRIGDATKLQEVLETHTLMPRVVCRLVIDYVPDPKPIGYKLKRTWCAYDQFNPYRKKASKQDEPFVVHAIENHNSFSLMSMCSLVGNQLVVGHNHKSNDTFLWNLRDQSVEKLPINTNISALEISPRGDYVAFWEGGTGSKPISLLNLQSKKITQLCSTDKHVHGICFTSDSSACMASHSSNIIVWRLTSESPTVLVSLPLRKETLDNFRINGDDTLLVARYKSGWVSLWKNPLSQDAHPVDCDTQDRVYHSQLSFLSDRNEIVVYNTPGRRITIYAIKDDPLRLEKAYEEEFFKSLEGEMSGSMQCLDEDSDCSYIANVFRDNPYNRLGFVPSGQFFIALTPDILGSCKEKVSVYEAEYGDSPITMPSLISMDERERKKRKETSGSTRNFGWTSLAGLYHAFKEYVT